MSYSQLGQDLNVLKIYNNKKSGFFLEIGANDGIFFSNTYLLEKEYDWSGICVEPIPTVFEKLVMNRPKSFCCDRAIYNQSDLTLEFSIANMSDMLSGITQYIDCHRESVNKNKSVIEVKTMTLLDLLDKYNAPPFIEYLSIDTEGSEYEILKSFDFQKYVFGIIDVEHNYIEPRRSNIRELLLANGYLYLGPNKWDDSYKHNSLL